MVKKTAVKDTIDVDPAALLKEVKHVTHRKRLQAAIQSMQEMESAAMDEGGAHEPAATAPAAAAARRRRRLWRRRC